MMHAMFYTVSQVQLTNSWLHSTLHYVDLVCNFEGVHPRDEVRYDWSTPTNRSVDSTRMQTLANGTLRIRNPSKNFHTFRSFYIIANGVEL